MYIPFWLEITAHFVEVRFFAIFKLILRSYNIFLKFHKNTTRRLRMARLFDQKVIWLNLGGREAVR